MEHCHLLKEKITSLRESPHRDFAYCSRMFLFTNIFLWAALFLIAVSPSRTGISFNSGSAISIGGRSQQRFSFSAKRLLFRVILNSVWIATFDVYHNIIAMNDGRGRIIPYWTFMSERNFSLGKHYTILHPGEFSHIFTPHTSIFYV